MGKECGAWVSRRLWGGSNTSPLKTTEWEATIKVALRSSAQSLLFVPKANCSSLEDRAFAHAAPVLWNSLPLTIRTSSSLAIFKKQLKTFFIINSFNAFQYFNFKLV